MNREGIILIVAGALVILFSHPRIGRPIVERLSNEGVVTPKLVKPEKAEIIKYAGPNLSLFVIGFVLIILGIIIL